LEGTPGEVRIVDVDSGAERRLPFELDLARMPGTDRPDVVYEILAVAWAPDGAHLAVAGGAFSSYPDMASGLNEVQVFVVRPDGTGLRRVGPRVGGATERLSWRPDSDAVLLTQYYRMAYSQVRAMDLQSGSLSDVQGTAILTYASWSPDGHSIAAGYPLDQTYVQGPADLVVFGGASEPRRTVFTADDGLSWVRLYPAWSPDGKWIACGVQDGFIGQGASTVKLVPADGGSPRVLASDAGQPAWRPILPPPAPSLALAADGIVEGEPLRVSGAVEDDGHGPLEGVRVPAGRQTWDLPVDGAGRYRGELRPQPGDYEVRAAAVREGVEGESSPVQALSVRSKSAALFGFDEGWLGVVHSVGAVRSWTAPLRAKGWTAAATENSDAAAAARLMQGKGLVVFYGHGLYVRAPGGDGALPGFALAFDDSYLATTDKVVAHAAASGSPRWTTMESVDLSALEVAVYLGCGTGANAGNRNSLLAYTTGSGAAAAVGFTREVHALFETTPWLNAFRDYVLEDACDVRTAAFRAEQDCAVFGSLAVVAQRREAGAVYLDQAPARVEAGGGGGW
jgi:hypothetical protein